MRKKEMETTGLLHLDRVIQSVYAGDNILWRVDTVEDYIPFVRRFSEYQLSRGNNIVYFRFGTHKAVLEEKQGVTIHRTHPDTGFEYFITEIHSVIRQKGKGHYFIFDSLSDLSHACYSDRMIGNFFKLTCPYLNQMDTVAYFCLYRYFHSYHAATPISATTQLLLDVYRHEDTLYVKPSKLEGRPTEHMFVLYEWKQGEDIFPPVKASAKISEIIASSPWPGLPSTSYRMVGVWDKLFINAESVLDSIRKAQYSKEKETAVLHQILRLVISRDRRMFELAARHLTIKDVITIWKRMIGTGMIGGKSIGMLLARKILKKQSDTWSKLLEEHDSFFIGSDVFYTFLVENNCWWARQRQKNPEAFLDGNEDVRERILNGTFPNYIVTRFSDMLDYYGQSPIIVRSSSLLEDNFGNAFAGKYESVFCANQGSREERLEALINAVRIIYASTMSDAALSYRKNRGVLDKDEQMALLVQRVSGVPYGNFFFPHLAGVGFSLNPYAWNKDINPEAGMLRLVFGLGTRAVDRSDDDYTRVVALNAPEKRPEANFDEVKRYAQRRVDVLNLDSNEFQNHHYYDVLKESADIPVTLFATRDRNLEKQYRSQGMKTSAAYVLTFDNLFKQTDFVTIMQEMLHTVKDAYGTNVDIEFTANFLDNGNYKINLVQCRPFQVQKSTETYAPLPKIREDRVIMKAEGAVIGHSRQISLDRIIYVAPEVYGKLSEKKRYALAKLIGTLTHFEKEDRKNIMLIGPGRWGTSTPSLGIPVSFHEINTVSILCEIDSMHEGLVPDLSLGTHFFNEMVEMNMLYLAYFVGKETNMLNRNFLQGNENCLTEVFPDAKEWESMVSVIDMAHTSQDRQIFLNADSEEQKAVLFLE